jgi:hypothetical protein
VRTATAISAPHLFSSAAGGGYLGAKTGTGGRRVNHLADSDGTFARSASSATIVVVKAQQRAQLVFDTSDRVARGACGQREALGYL